MLSASFRLSYELAMNKTYLRRGTCLRSKGRLARRIQ